MNKLPKKLPIKRLCAKVGMSSQNFYKGRTVRQRKEVDEQLIKQMVQAERMLQPRLGGLKLHNLLYSEMVIAGVSIGRDKFFKVLRNQGLLLKPLPKAPRTTNSQHSLPVFMNLINDMELTGPNQAWASDITYIRTVDGFLYLSLITDLYSRKIVGYHLGQTLEVRDTLKALEMATATMPSDANLTHHSDRGCQYCSHAYVTCLKEHGISISMTEENHCAENALAERVNGILKQYYYLGCEFKNIKDACIAVDQAIHLYNTRRPHRSLKLRTPHEVHSVAA